MVASKRILLVEGQTDKVFFSSVCESLKLHATVHVGPPKDIGGGANNKEGALKLLPNLLGQLADGQVHRLALVLDADHVEAGGLGYQRTKERVESIFNEYGFTLKNGKPNEGLVFKSSDGLSDLGLWIMPGNGQDGMLEDWIASAIKEEDQKLFASAVRVVSELENPKFKKLHQIKANVSTWLAWQKDPGHGLKYAIERELIDDSSPHFRSFSSWLMHIFK